MSWSGVIQIAIKCHMNVIQFHFDTQVCPIRWAPVPTCLMVNKEGFVVTEEDDGSSTPSHNAEWQLVKFLVKDGTYFLHLKRNHFRAISPLIITILLGALVILVYILPISSGERIGYSITLVLSISFFIVGIGDILPPSPTMTIVGKCENIQYVFLFP